MKINIKKSICVFILTLCIASNALSEAGAPIPPPRIALNKAAELATNYFYGKWRDIFAKTNTRVEDYIITSVEWTNHFNNAYQKKWVWKIKFVHPIQNDHSVTYQVTDKGIIIEEVMTK